MGSYLDYKDALDAAKALRLASEHKGSQSCLDYRDSLDAEKALRLALEHNSIDDIMKILLSDSAKN
jgi:thiamine pyrophosphokinase